MRSAAAASLDLGKKTRSRWRRELRSAAVKVTDGGSGGDGAQLRGARADERARQRARVRRALA